MDLWKDFWRLSSTCAFLLWLGARLGMAGTGSLEGVEAVDAMTGFEEKKSFVVASCIISEKGVMGVSGERSEVEELSAVKKPLSMLLKSLSELTESAEEFVEPRSAEVLRISGAFRAWTLVVLMSSVGSEIFARLIVPGAYRTLQLREASSLPRVWARARLVKLRTRDILGGVW